MNLSQKMQLAYNIKLENFGKNIEFVYPNQTLAVSITDTDCSLGCAHCNGHYLKNMTPINEYEKDINKRNITSILLSGGCSKDGDVAIDSYIETIKDLKNKGYKLNSHIGLMNKENIDLVCKFLDYVSFDLIFDEETIKEVYKMNKSREEYIATYEYIQKHTQVAPHICIGLKGGKIKGEYEIIEYLEKDQPEQVTFIVLIPTKNTDYEDVNPPNLNEVVDLLCEARIRLSNTKINLGCMRPRGKYRSDLDKLAIECGINKIVLPSRSCKNLALEMELDIKESKECCIL
ncbi:radical SAM protein [Paraclostridium ghonii]|uniref:Radical SAM superfamily protein n=1 Tax=Paraclostridium ghonii TaxID=29358 RepID=A0ABU0N0H5_9FIRM|nr:radical SAM protein [Paeniclostridium ghonii]MDQ0556616.1 putative radical SAM superfamily protein [Paeniclostridium ghonii]